MGETDNLKTCQGYIVKFKRHFKEPNHSLFSFSLLFFLSLCLSFFSPGCRPFESTNGLSSWRHWNVNEPSACSWRSESSGLFIELPEPRAWLAELGSRRITQRGGALQGSVRLQRGGVCGARVEKEECCQSLGQIGSWSKQGTVKKDLDPR